jgi:hypothetical protein
MVSPTGCLIGRRANEPHAETMWTVCRGPLARIRTAQIMQSLSVKFIPAEKYGATVNLPYNHRMAVRICYPCRRVVVTERSICRSSMHWSQSLVTGVHSTPGCQPECIASPNALFIAAQNKRWELCSLLLRHGRKPTRSGSNDARNYTTKRTGV